MPMIDSSTHLLVDLSVIYLLLFEVYSTCELVIFLLHRSPLLYNI